MGPRSVLEVWETALGLDYLGSLRVDVYAPLSCDVSAYLSYRLGVSFELSLT